MAEGETRSSILYDPFEPYALADGVGDWGVAGNGRWNYRFNLNLGYYF